MSLYGIGVGSSGARASVFVQEALRALSSAAELRVLAVSDRYGSLPEGGGTDAPFVNAALVVVSGLPPRALLGWLLSLERRFGRVRGARYGGRSLDLDLLWSSGAALALPSLQLPHPRLEERAFAVAPLLEALRRAGRPPPLGLEQAARRTGPPRLRRLLAAASPEGDG